ncbi:carbonic anhydrase [Rosenbergiella nectarea]|uniref:carbonic anhydrase n=1 Tax=Rosenbergiella nectarea TaxID=988801 RepID=UPI001BDB3548|nr:carbonic anhydrase family protein [Rosenbergiella nectarea]MBT0728609.1 carbonic anhydrase family protein [Rosenbergiella nectarea subsp. apis]
MKGFLPLFFTFALVAPSAHAIPWSYEGNNSPENWGTLSSEYQMCKEGAYQSPIDIKGTIDAKLPPLALHFRTHTTSIINNGHTLQLNVDDEDNFALDGINFKLKQFHFHAPSENTINGKSFPLEAHFVHSDAEGNLAVLAVMFEVGDKNPALQQIIDQAPVRKYETQPLDKSINITSLFPASTHYYRFSGSLTTPPCTEGVRWLVMKESVSLSAQQLESIKSLLGMTNNRPIQPLNGRMVVQ